MLIQSFSHNEAIDASMHFSFHTCFVKHNGQPPQLMEDKGDLLIYLYLFFCLLPFKIQNENGSIKSFSVIISFFLNFDPPIQCIPIQYQTNNVNSPKLYMGKSYEDRFLTYGTTQSDKRFKKRVTANTYLTLSCCKALKHLKIS
ncbi:unnamed protein product [Rotaria magnacalcarata]|uniref:Uncharacterized protein n=1 Tax=Rotaria magnacalcarata TaxID=392030 RepID=A0A8S3H8U9_9BILA|nr:unnamed protein product [Rotaria magnacalcarata]